MQKHNLPPLHCPLFSPRKYGHRTRKCTLHFVNNCIATSTKPAETHRSEKWRPSRETDDAASICHRGSLRTRKLVYTMQREIPSRDARNPKLAASSTESTSTPLPVNSPLFLSPFFKEGNRGARCSSPFLGHGGHAISFFEVRVKQVFGTVAGRCASLLARRRHKSKLPAACTRITGLRDIRIETVRGPVCTCLYMHIPACVSSLPNR